MPLMYDGLTNVNPRHFTRAVKQDMLSELRQMLTERRTDAERSEIEQYSEAVESRIAIEDRNE